MAVCEAHGVRAVAAAAGLSHSVALGFVRDGGRPDPGTVTRLQQALAALVASNDRSGPCWNAPSRAGADRNAAVGGEDRHRPGEPSGYAVWSS